MRVWMAWVFCVFFCVPEAAASRVVSVGWDDYPPYQMSAIGERQGIDMDIIRLALRRAGYEVKFVKLPWARQLLMLQNGTLAIAMSASKSEERAAFAVWSDPYREERITLMGLNSNTAKITSLTQLMGEKVRIGVIRDSTFPGEYAGLLPNPAFQQLLEFSTLNVHNLSKLRLGRIDYLIDDPVTIQYQTSLVKGPKVRTVLEMQNEGSHFMIAKKFVAGKGDFVSRLNGALRSMKTDATTGKIFKRYGIDK